MEKSTQKTWEIWRKCVKILENYSEVHRIYRKITWEAYRKFMQSTGENIGLRSNFNVRNNDKTLFEKINSLL